MKHCIFEHISYRINPIKFQQLVPLKRYFFVVRFYTFCTWCIVFRIFWVNLFVIFYQNIIILYIFLTNLNFLFLCRYWAIYIQSFSRCFCCKISFSRSITTILFLVINLGTPSCWIAYYSMVNLLCAICFSITRLCEIVCLIWTFITTVLLALRCFYYRNVSRHF